MTHKTLDRTKREHTLLQQHTHEPSGSGATKKNKTALDSRHNAKQLMLAALTAAGKQVRRAKKTKVPRKESLCCWNQSPGESSNEVRKLANVLGPADDEGLTCWHSGLVARRLTPRSIAHIHTSRKGEIPMPVGKHATKDKRRNTGATCPKEFQKL